MADLRELGLTKNEERAFRTIVRLGKAGSTEISKESGVTYGRIYNILAALEQKGLVKVIPEKGKKFIPGDPEVLKEVIAGRRKALAEVEKEVDGLKKVYELKEREAVEVARGRASFYKLVRQFPKPKRTEYRIRYVSEFNPEWVREVRMALRTGVEMKELVRFDKEAEKNVRRWLKVHKDIRIIPNEGISITIVDEEAILIALIKANTQLLIRDRPFIKLMKELFRSYYRQAKAPSP